MEKNIWHPGEEKPQTPAIIVYKTQKGVNGVLQFLTASETWCPYITPAFYTFDDIDTITHWAYLDDVINQAEEADRWKTSAQDYKDWYNKSQDKLKNILDIVNSSMNRTDVDHDSYLALDSIEKIIKGDHE